MLSNCNTRLPLDIIVGKPTMDTMNKMVEQMAQMVAQVKTSAWGGLHGTLSLVLDDTDYTTITKGTVTSTTLVAQPYTVNKKITATANPLEILTLQEETKKLLREFELQEAVTNIGVQQIRLINLKRCVLHLAGTKNSNRTDRICFW